MPRDRVGNNIRIGDVIILECYVREIVEVSDYGINVSIEPRFNSFRDSLTIKAFGINARQIEVKK